MYTKLGVNSILDGISKFFWSWLVGGECVGDFTPGVESYLREITQQKQYLPNLYWLYTKIG